jgi:hypothetical protein
MTGSKVLLICGVAALEVFAILGWTRDSSPSPAQPLLNPAGVAAMTPINTDAVPSYDPVPPTGGDFVYGEMPSYVTKPAVRTIARAQVVPEPMDTQISTRTTSSSTTGHRVRRRDRPFSHSAAIVGGSAGAGAIIGALAGGGKGAGIGALAGGGAGLAYDRLTHKKD